MACRTTGIGIRNASLSTAGSQNGAYWLNFEYARLSRPHLRILANIGNLRLRSRASGPPIYLRQSASCPPSDFRGGCNGPRFNPSTGSGGENGAMEHSLAQPSKEPAARNSSIRTDRWIRGNASPRIRRAAPNWSICALPNSKTLRIGRFASKESGEMPSASRQAISSCTVFSYAIR